MKQQGELTVRKGTRKVTVDLETMPHRGYQIAISILEPKEFNRDVIPEVTMESKEAHKFVITFPKKLAQKVVLHWQAEIQS